MKKIVLYIILGAISFYLLYAIFIGIPANISHYSFSDFVVVVLLCGFLFFLISKLAKHIKSPSKTNSCADSTESCPSDNSHPSPTAPSNVSDYEDLLLHMQKWKEQYFIDNGSRTSERQKATLEIILKDPEQDLYKLSSHGATCAFCAPREGRVYSRSGKDPIFPPLAIAFQKIDPSGPDVLWNTYLVTHPNTLHVISSWTPAGRSEDEINEIQHLSSLITNPFSHDPRSPRQKELYRKKQIGRKKWLRDYRLFELCSHAGIKNFPKTFQTFQKHKLSNSPKYQEWMRQYSQLKRK